MCKQKTQTSQHICIVWSMLSIFTSYYDVQMGERGREAFTAHVADRRPDQLKHSHNMIWVSIAYLNMDREGPDQAPRLKNFFHAQLSWAWKFSC